MILPKKIALRLTSLLLLALMLLGGVACGIGDPVDATGGESTPEATEAASPSFNLTSDYVIVRPTEENQLEKDAMTLLNRGLSSALGITLKLKDDWVRQDSELIPNEYEILIGTTNRPESQEAYKSLSRLDYTYEVFGRNVIVICGGCPEATMLAARAFLKDIFGYEEEAGQPEAPGQSASLTTGLKFTFEYDYPVKELKIGDVPIGEFALVSPQGADDATDVIIAAIAELCGYSLPVIRPQDYSGQTPAILLGCGDPSGGHLEQPFGDNTYYITATAGSVPQIIIDTKHIPSRKAAAEHFVGIYFANTKLSSKMNLPLQTNLLTGFALGNDSKHLVFSKIEETQTLSPGIEYTKRLYYTFESYPVRAYVLTVSPGSGKFHTGTPGDGTVLLNKYATVLAEMNSAAANGKKVVAGVNGDFYDLGGNYLPRGLCVKEGQMLTPAGGYPWFGVLGDGTPVIGSASDYNKYSSSLHTAVGGRQILLSGGLISNVELGKEFGYTRHPRTAVGIRADGTVVIVVVDGRQKDTVSEGISLADLAIMFRELGCTDAINLDGGGSSTFIIGSVDGAFTTKNSPSDGRLRGISNSLLVLLPD